MAKGRMMTTKLLREEALLLLQGVKDCGSGAQVLLAM